MTEDALKKLDEEFADLIEIFNRDRSDSTWKSFERVEKFLHRRSKINWKRKKILLLSFAVLFISILIVYIRQNDQFLYDIYFFVLSLLRIFLVKILPIWDWTRIYTSPCLIGNPFYRNTIDIDECNKCENISGISRLSNLTFFNFTKSIYLNHLPVIVDDATGSWPAMKKLNVRSLFQLYADDPILSEHDLCHFQSNIRQYDKVGGADRLFRDYLQGNRRSFIVQWNNCKRETMKVIRSFYSKPYFLPPSIGQTLMENWFLVSSGMDKGPTRLHRLPGGAEWHWLVQIEGRSLIKFYPQHPCEDICSPLKSIKLDAGEMLIYSMLYNVSYSPLTKETILLLQGFE